MIFLREIEAKRRDDGGYKMAVYSSCTCVVLSWCHRYVIVVFLSLSHSLLPCYFINISIKSIDQLSKDKYVYTYDMMTIQNIYFQRVHLLFYIKPIEITGELSRL